MTRFPPRFPWMLLALGIVLAHAPALAQGGGRGAQLEDLLPRLAKRAAIYNETALGQAVGGAVEGPAGDVVDAPAGASDANPWLDS